MAEIKCLSPNFREELLELAKAAGVKATDIKLLEEIPDCEKGHIEVTEGCGKPGRSGKRAPSAYNIFIGDCMRGKSGRSMQECAADYKKRPKGG